ncbi:MAG: hypothetical protein WDO56_30495 [Gammaproteobacteria bacterium]
MTIDATSNSQYIALKQSYDDKIDKAPTARKYYDVLKEAKDQLAQSGAPAGSAYAKSLQDKVDKAQAALDYFDPDGSLRKEFDAGKSASDVNAGLNQEETQALGHLAAVLEGADAIAQADAQSKKLRGQGMEPDLITRVMLTFAMLGQANEAVTKGYMDGISENVDKITELSGLSETVRVVRPGGTDSNKTAEVSADVIKKLQSLGVQVPTDKMKLSSDGKTYTASQTEFDTINSNVQSESSSLTTLNQNTTIDLNKSIDVGQQCTTFQSSDLEKWAQVMNKLAS